MLKALVVFPNRLEASESLMQQLMQPSQMVVRCRTSVQFFTALSAIVGYAVRSPPPTQVSAFFREWRQIFRKTRFVRFSLPAKAQERFCGASRPRDVRWLSVVGNDVQKSSRKVQSLP